MPVRQGVMPSNKARKINMKKHDIINKQWEYMRAKEQYDRDAERLERKIGIAVAIILFIGLIVLLYLAYYIVR